MNKLHTILCMSLLSGSILLGDAVDEGLSVQATEQLKVHTRLMIQSGVASQDALRMTRAMEDRQFPVAEILRAQETVMQALREGLPAEPLLSKAQEGMTKGARAQEVTQAMARTRSRYERAYRNAAALTGSGPEANKTGEVIAEALAAGLAEQDADRILDRLRTMAKDRLHLLARECYLTAKVMAGYRVSSEAAANTVCSALQSGYRGQDLEALRTMFMKRAKLENPTLVAMQYMKRIQNGAPLSGLDGNGSQGPAGGSSEPGGSNGSGPGGKGPGGKGSSGKGAAGSE
jgi:uncharacterized membrane protein YgcG